MELAQLANEYIKQRQADLIASKQFYFQRLIPHLRPLVEAAPGNAELRHAGYTTLISLMGFSPETTVFSALVLRPARVLIICSDNAQKSAEPAIRYMLDEKLVDYFSLKHVIVNAFEPRSIYERTLEEYRNWLGTFTSEQAAAERPILDITGGTKVMSFTGGFLAWEGRMDICYLNGEWDPRSGAAGLSKASTLKVLRRPSSMRGHQLREQALLEYAHGHYVAARRDFDLSRGMIPDSHLDTLGFDLCHCYCAMMEFDRKGLAGSVARLQETLCDGGVKEVCEKLRINPQEHVLGLKQFAAGDTLSLIAGYLELSEIYARQERRDFAGLLAYRAMEALVEFGLRRLCPEFEMHRPDWAALGDPATIADRFAKASPTGDSPLPDRLGLLSGFNLLVALTDLGQRFVHSGKKKDAVVRMIGIAQLRNRSYLAHGYENLSKKDTEALRNAAEELARGVLAEQYGHFAELRSRVRPLPLK